MSNKWEDELYSVSSWNYADEVVKEFDLPKKLRIHDTTLRDGEQQSGVILSADEKIAIGEQLAEMGVDRIEACMPVVSKDDQRVLTELCKRGWKDTEIVAFSRANTKDVQIALDCGAKAIEIEIPGSQGALDAYGWDYSKALGLAVDALGMAKENGMFTTFFTVDGTRGEMPFFLGLIGDVYRQVHMDSLALVDTAGVLNPEAIKYMVRNVRGLLPDIPLEVHCHNDLGLAVANSIAAVSCGVGTVHTTVLGMGERAGGASLEEVVMATKTLYGLDNNLKLERLKPLCDKVAEMGGLRVPTNKPIVGKNLFSIESGVPANLTDKAIKAGKPATTIFPFDYRMVGYDRFDIVLGKGSGDGSVRSYAEDLGMDLTKEQITALTGKIKAFAVANKRPITLQDFKHIVYELRHGS